MLGWRILGDLFAEDIGQTDDGCRGLRQTLRISGIFFRRLMHESSAGAACGDIGKRVRAVRWIDEIAQQHDIVTNTIELDAMRFESSKNGLQIVDIFGESAVGERFLDTGLIERDLEGGSDR